MTRKYNGFYPLITTITIINPTYGDLKVSSIAQTILNIKVIITRSLGRLLDKANI
jgi:hypothetical protein